MKASKTVREKLIDRMCNGGDVLEPHGAGKLETTTDMEELNRRSAQTLSYDLL